MTDFLINNVFWIAIAAWFLGAAIDALIRRYNNVKIQLVHNIALGGGGATHFTMMMLFGVLMLLNADNAKELQEANPELLGLAAIYGAGSLLWLYFTGDPYSPPKASVGQKLLEKLGYYDGDVDGHCGRRTRRALGRFLCDVAENKHGNKSLERAKSIPWFRRRRKNNDFKSKKARRITNRDLLVMVETDKFPDHRNLPPPE